MHCGLHPKDLGGTLRSAATCQSLNDSKTSEVTSTLRRLTEIAIAGLVPMFDPDKQLFCHRLNRTGHGLVREGISPRYTVITLLGLHRLEQNGRTSPIAIQPVLEKLLDNTRWIDCIGDLGLLMWLCALAAPERLSELANRLHVKDALSFYSDARHGRTMELAWFLAGLSHGYLALGEEFSEARDLAFQTYRLLQKNQGDGGAFGHVAHGRAFDILRRGIGTFADQVYPIYAMSKFGQAFGCEQATGSALDCALAICEAQGELGQWWWQYDQSNSQVAGPFPVYSVHQHGMAPMALLALGEVTQSDFTPWIHRGLSWINRNELDFPMEDASAGLIWRCISQPVLNRYWSVAVRMLTQSGYRTSENGMHVVYECRPYELGWLLYAFAGGNDE